MAQLHDGHRERVRQRFERDGAESFAPHELLEFILFYSIPRGDTNELAHRLLAHFGSLSAVLEAPCQELRKVEGVGPASAALLNALPQIARRYLIDKNGEGRVLDTAQKLGEFIKPYFVGCNNERFYLICLDRKRKLLCCAQLMEGSLNQVSVDLRTVVETVVRCSASSVVLAHNHTQGFALPSSEDIFVTDMVRKALHPLSVDVFDHIIVARDDFVSFSQSGLMVRC